MFSIEMLLYAFANFIKCVCVCVCVCSIYRVLSFSFSFFLLFVSRFGSNRLLNY